MRITDLKKDLSKTIRINSEVLRMIEDKGLSIQEFIDGLLNKEFEIKVTNKE